MTMVVVEEDLQTFIADAKEHLENIEQGLMTLEQKVDKPADVPLINELFRAAHSIKGAAGLLGLHPVAGLTHHLENLLHAIRSEKQAVNAEAIEVLFDGFDRLRSQIVDIAGGKPPSDANRDLADRVDEMLNGPADASFDPEALVALGIPRFWFAHIPNKVGRALVNAPRERRFIYRLRLALAACRRGEEGSISHPILERLEMFAVVAARYRVNPQPPEEVFDQILDVLVMSSADPDLVPILLGDRPQELETIFIPGAASVVEPLPWQEALTLLYAVSEAIHRHATSSKDTTEPAALQEGLKGLRHAAPRLGKLRSFGLLEDFVHIIFGKITPVPETVRLLRGLFLGLLEEANTLVQEQAGIHVLEKVAAPGELFVALEAASEAGGARILVDISEIDSIEGHDLEQLVAWHHRLGKLGGALVLVHAGKRRTWLRRVLDLAGFGAELPLWPSVPEGLLGFGQHAEVG